MASYVVKSWYADQRANPRGQYISIKGRASGVVSWVMSLIGISPTFSLECGCNNFVYEIGSWSGKRVTTIPLAKISSVYYGYTKPWKEALAIGIVGFFAGNLAFAMTHSLATSAISTLMVWTLAVVYYALNKDLSIGVCETGGILSSVDFRRSVIEGIAVDEAAAERVHLIILALVERSNPKL